MAAHACNVTCPRCKGPLILRYTPPSPGATGEWDLSCNLSLTCGHSIKGNRADAILKELMQRHGLNLKAKAKDEPAQVQRKLRSIPSRRHRS